MGHPLKSNWLDQCRLGLAALVIFSHSFPLTGSPEPMRELTGASDFGKIAVCGFMIISGYLIAQAWDRSVGFLPYLRNRILRIVPGFVVAFALSILAAALVGGTIYWTALLICLALLSMPPAFFPDGGSFANANGSMWTIQVEFFCYLIAPLAFCRRATLISLWIIAAYVTIAITSDWARLILMFLSGACYWRFGVAPRGWAMILSAVTLPILLFQPSGWQIGLATFGTYLLLGFGLRERPGFAWSDISYGVYLYGWPVQKLLIMAGVSNPWLLAPAALIISCALGALSWSLVERHALKLKRSGLPMLALTPAK